MGSFWKITTLAFDLPSGENYDDDNIDISPPETENWTPTERRRKRNPLLFLPEDDNSIKFFEKGLHQTVDRPESERDLTPYGGLNFSWQIQEELQTGNRVKLTSDTVKLNSINLEDAYHGREGMVQYLGFVGKPYTSWDEKYKGSVEVKLFDDNDWVYIPYSHWQEFLEIIPHITSSLKLSWGHARNIWVTHWAIPGNQKMNPTNVQQDWMVVTFLPPDVDGDYTNSFKVIKDRFKAYVRQNFPETIVDESDYMWANAYLWNVQSEKSDFLDKYLTTEEINNMKEDTIVVIDKQDFPVEVSSYIERI